MERKIKMRYPEIVASHLPKDKKVEPFGKITKEKTKTILSQNYRGVTHKDGGFRVNPGGLFKNEKLSTGVYKVLHQIGYLNISLSVSLLVQPGSFQIKENSPDYFVVETYQDGKLEDLDFTFTLAKILDSQN